MTKTERERTYILKGFNLVFSTSLASRDDGTGMSHAATRWGRKTSDKG